MPKPEAASARMISSGSTSVIATRVEVEVETTCRTLGGLEVDAFEQLGCAIDLGVNECFALID